MQTQLGDSAPPNGLNSLSTPTSHSKFYKNYTKIIEKIPSYIKIKRYTFIFQMEQGIRQNIF